MGARNRRKRKIKTRKRETKMGAEVDIGGIRERRGWSKKETSLEYPPKRPKIQHIFACINGISTTKMERRIKIKSERSRHRWKPK